jgi:putative FmdB family regulatory protein
MPTYDYLCDGCGHEFELFQSINDKHKRKCPECKKLKLRRLFGTGAAVMFKGSGFYETDYRSESYKKGAEKEKKAKESAASDKKDSSSKSSGDSKKKDSKPKKSTGDK